MADDAATPDDEATPDDAATPGDADDDATITHRQLRGALELAAAVAAEPARYGASGADGPPEGMRRDAGKRRLAIHELGRVRREIGGVPRFRELVADAAGERLDELAQLWLRRPPAWQERARLLIGIRAEQEGRAEAESSLKKEQKRRESAERKQQRLTESAERAEGRIESLSRRVEELRGELDEQRETVAALREELAASRTQGRHATDRQQAAERRRDELQHELDDSTRHARSAEAQRDELLAQRASSGGAIGGSNVGDVRKLVGELRRRADQLHQLLDPPQVASRQPIAIPGSIHGDRDAVAELLLRSGALVVVDGYNVTMLSWPDLSLADQRRRLLDVIDDVVRRYASEVAVVFDGADVVGATAEARRLSRVRYSPAGITADDVIRDEVAALATERPVVVVTNDREIVRDVARQGANVLSSDEFARFATR